MIMIYGPAGAGKSTQGRILAEKYGWKWLSAGQIIRDSGEFQKFTESGKMIDEKVLVGLIAGEVKKAEDEGKEVIFDGQPGSAEQVDFLEEAGILEKVKGIIVIKVSREELFKRLAQRGRDDDNEQVWRKKIDYFEQKIYTFIEALERKGMKVLEVDGNSNIEQVTMEMVEACEDLLED